MRIIEPFLALLFLIPSIVSASEVVLKSGQKLEGKITEQTDKYIKMDPGVGMAMTYYADEIDTVNGQKMAPDQKQNITPPIDSSMNTVSVGDKTARIVDSFARLYGSSTSPILTVSFFSQQLTKEQKEKLIMHPGSFINSLIGIYPILEINFTFKDGSQNCSDNNFTGYVAVFEKSDIYQGNGYPLNWPERRKNQEPLATIGVNKFSCSSLAKGSRLVIDIKKNEMLKESSLLFAWDINMDLEIDSDPSHESKPTVRQSGPIIIKFDANDFAPLTDSFNLQGLFLVYYHLHGQWPGNSDIEELKNTSNQMAASGRVDIDKYDFDFQPQDDGGLKIKFKLKTDSNWGNISLQKPIQK